MVVAAFASGRPAAPRSNVQICLSAHVNDGVVAVAPRCTQARRGHRAPRCTRALRHVGGKPGPRAPLGKHERLQHFTVPSRRCGHSHQKTWRIRCRRAPQPWPATNLSIALRFLLSSYDCSGAAKRRLVCHLIFSPRNGARRGLQYCNSVFVFVAHQGIKTGILWNGGIGVLRGKSSNYCAAEN